MLKKVMIACMMLTSLTTNTIDKKTWQQLGIATLGSLGTTSGLVFCAACLGLKHDHLIQFDVSKKDEFRAFAAFASMMFTAGCFAGAAGIVNDL